MGPPVRSNRRPPVEAVPLCGHDPVGVWTLGAINRPRAGFNVGMDGANREAKFAVCCRPSRRSI